MHPYAPIRTEPMVVDGKPSGYRMVQIETEHRNTETDMPFTTWDDVSKPVSNNYLLVENSDVRNIVEDLTSKTTWSWDSEPKTFFDGKRFMITRTTEEIQSDVDVGDAVSLGIGAWNSYDGSKAFSLFMFINRLICTNGMMSKDMFNTFRFKHTLKNVEWKDEAEKAFRYIQNGPEKLKEWTNTAKNLLNPIDMSSLEDIRKNHINDLPVTTYGKIMDKFWNNEEKTGWGFLNAGADILWHNETPTVSMYEQNALFTDAMLGYSSSQLGSA